MKLLTFCAILSFAVNAAQFLIQLQEHWYNWYNLNWCVLTQPNVLVIVTGSRDQETLGEFAHGTLVSTHAATIDPADLVCTKTGPECAPDCSTLMMCNRFSTEPFQLINCTSPNQYCVGGACASTPQGPNCTLSGPAFMCTDVGLFPEPSNCSQYRDCDEEGKLYECPKGFNFNSQLNLCQAGATCTKIDCSKATAVNTYILFTANPAFYAYCLIHGNGVIQTIMFKCEIDGEVFDMTTKTCQFKCKAKGNFKNPANYQTYYYCSSANAKPTLLECADYYVFDGVGCNRDASNLPTTT